MDAVLVGSELLPKLSVRVTDPTTEPPRLPGLRSEPGPYVSVAIGMDRALRVLLALLLFGMFALIIAAWLSGSQL